MSSLGYNGYYEQTRTAPSTFRETGLSAARAYGSPGARAPAANLGGGRRRRTGPRDGEKALTWNTDSWTALGSVASAIGTLVAAAGIFYTRRALQLSIRATELSTLESILRDIREMDRQYIADFHGFEPNKKIAWAVSYFQTIEYLCFIRRKVPELNTLMAEFFPRSLMTSWWNQYVEFTRQGLIQDGPENFSEFKMLCDNCGIKVTSPLQSV